MITASEARKLQEDKDFNKVIESLIMYSAARGRNSAILIISEAEAAVLRSHGFTTEDTQNDCCCFYMTGTEVSNAV